MVQITTLRVWNLNLLSVQHNSDSKRNVNEKKNNNDDDDGEDKIKLEELQGAFKHISAFNKQK